ncbi:activating signal cointegrator 1 complex subunit 1-like [Drosophila subpulchrella]|uniref:activating signal cointegrator 1 complex subunit 1-like n=1 Tax=Drosophila subpulchrella TaxID=1486046 RepID=UPI0018A1A703|nr:activating signal cointegrator 1 complex subunit 1-like [Drosophila subpulchrella]
MSFKVETKAFQSPDLHCEDENDPVVSHIEQEPNGDFKLAFYVPRSCYGRLIGLKGATRRSIQDLTNSEVSIPGLMDKSTDVVIRAKQRSHVVAALRQIRHLITSQRKRATHFLTVTLNSGNIQDRYVELKRNILEAKFPGIDEGLFISENCLHFTFGVCVLLDDEEHQRALNELQACRALLADLKTPFEVKVKGLEVSHDDPRSTRRLYGRIESPDLQKFADQCFAHFQRTGLCPSDKYHRDSIQMHITIMNVRFRQAEMKPGDTFDAREILDRFGDFDFGTIQCQAVKMCVLGSRVGDNFYKISGSLEF